MTLTRYLAHLPRWGVAVAVALEDGTQSPSRRRRQRLYAVTECADHFCFWHRLCEKSREPRKRRIVFSIAVSRPRLPVQLVSVSMKLRQMFYTQIERRTFHTAWTRGEHYPWGTPAMPYTLKDAHASSEEGRIVARCDGAEAGAMQKNWC